MALVDLTNALAQDHTGQAAPTSVRLTDGTNWLVPVLASDTQQVGGTVVANQGAAAAGSAAWPVVTVDGSNVLVRPGDAANSALRVNVVAGGAGGGAAQFQLRNAGDTAWVNIGIGQQTMAASVPVVLASDQSVIAVSAATLPLPTGAATESTLASVLTSSTFTGRINTLGQKTSAASTPIVIASDQSALPVTDNSGSLTIDSAQLPSALVSGRLDVNVGNALTVTANAGSGTFANQQSNVSADYDTGAGTQTTTMFGLALPASGGAVAGGTAANPIRVDPTGSTTQPISAASLPLPTGAATETTLSTRLADSTFTGRINTLGAKTSAASTPVVLATDQAALPITDNAGSLTVDSLQLPAALVGARLDTNNGAWLGSTAPTVGQKTAASSLPIVIASDQSTLAVAGAKTNNNAVPGATNVGALPAVATAAAPGYTEGNQVALSTDLTGAVRITGSISASNPSVGSNNAAIPTSATQVGGSDGTNLQAARVFDLDSGAGTQYVLGVGLRRIASGGSVEAGTSSDPLRTDPTGTTAQPITDNAGSLTVDAPVGTPVASRLSDGAAFLTTTGGRLSVDGSGVTQPISAAALPLPAGASSLAEQQTQTTALQLIDNLPHAMNAAFSNAAAIGGQLDDTSTTAATEDNVAPVRITAQRGLHANLRNAAGTETGTSGTPLRVDPTGTTTQPISAASLPLPAGASTETTLGTRLADATFTARVPTVGAKTSAASIPVVLATDEAALPITDNAGSLTVDAPVATPLAARLSDGAAFLTTTAGRLSVDGSGVTQPISAASLPLPTSAAQEHTTAASPHAVRLSDGAAFYTAPASGQLPAALVGARLDVNAGAWMGSTAATVGQKAMASSLPVALASDQSNVPMNIVQVAGGAVATGGVSGLLGVAGNVAHDAVDTGNPIKIGGRAQDPLPTQVTGNDRVDAWYDRRGRAYVSGDYHTGSRLAIGYVHSNRLAVLAAAHAATAGFLWIINQTGSSTFVRVRKALFKAFPVAITAFASAPRITLERFTFTGTASGASLGTALRGESGDAAFVNASVRTASTGMTITQGVALSAGIVPAVLTAVGVGTPTVQDLLQGLVDDFVVLTAGQGLVLRQTDAGTASDTRIATLDMLVEEYT